MPVTPAQQESRDIAGHDRDGVIDRRVAFQKDTEDECAAAIERLTTGR